MEKTGRHTKYYYHTGDKIKVKAFRDNIVYKGVLSEIGDSSIVISSVKSDLIPVKDIGCVYKQFAYFRKLGLRLTEFGGIIFAVMVVNNLINNSPAFNKYVFIVSGSFLGAGLIALGISERACKTGGRWKIKILEGTFN